MRSLFGLNDKELRRHLFDEKYVTRTLSAHERAIYICIGMAIGFLLVAICLIVLSPEPFAIHVGVAR